MYLTEFKAVMPRMIFDYGLMLGSGKSKGCNICRGQVVFSVVKHECFSINPATFMSKINSTNSDR